MPARVGLLFPASARFPEGKDTSIVKVDSKSRQVEKRKAIDNVEGGGEGGKPLCLSTSHCRLPSSRVTQDAEKEALPGAEVERGRASRALPYHDGGCQPILRCSNGQAPFAMMAPILLS